MTQALTSATQNLVVAFNSQTEAMRHANGQYTSSTYQGPFETVINAGPCRLVQICVVSKGTGTVSFYNSDTANSTPPTSLLFVLPSETAIGIIPVGMMFSLGLTMIADGPVAINATYSVG